MRLFARKKEVIPVPVTETIVLETEEEVIQRNVANKAKFIPIVEEIHETFYTEVDKLLAEAKISNSLETTKQSLIDKRNKLVSLGFSKTKECIEANAEIERLDKLKNDNWNKEQLIKAIDYFSTKYCNYKFITEESVKKICQKYNLIYGTVDKYIGEVPDVNIQHMLDFKISDEDKCYLETESYHGRVWNRDFISYKRYKERKDSFNFIGGGSYTDYQELSMEICAPVKDFDTKGMELKDFKLSKIEIPDPIVLQPVMFENQKYYLIVTAWGEEAKDSLVLNEKNN